MPRVSSQVVREVVKGAASDGTLASAIAQNNEKLRALQTKKHQNHRYYMAEEKVPVTISPFYRGHFGNVMTVSINGIALYVPCDGKRYLIPRTFADLVTERIMNVDAQIAKQSRRADVQKNFERSAGELPLV